MKSKAKELLQSRQELSSKLKEWKAVGSYKEANPFWKVFRGTVAVFFVAFWVAFFASSIFNPTEESEAAVVENNLTSGDYYVNIKSSDVTLDVVTTPSATNGAMTVASSTVSASSNVPTGYKLYLGISPFDSTGAEKSAADKQKNGLYLDGNLSRVDGAVIAGASGTATTPAALSADTWGYAVDKNSYGAPTVWTTEDHSTMSSAEPTSDKFAAVPTVGNDELIQTANGPTAEGSENTSTIYYGIISSGEKSQGAYSNTIAYTAVAVTDPSADLTFTPSSYVRQKTYEEMTSTDATVTIQTPIFTDMSDIGNISVTLSGGPLNETLNCGSPTASTDANHQLSITCYLPKGYAGKYNVVLNLPKFGQTFTGTYQYVVNDWQYISAMQEMTSTVCDSAGTVTSSTNPVPEKFLTDIRGGGGHINPSTGAYTETATGKYRVRKLADGHCWMTENLDLPQDTTDTFYSYDTNLTEVPDSATHAGTTGFHYAQDPTTGIISWSPSNDHITSAGQTDTNVLNDHTYYGNGNLGNRQATTTDGETQGIGTYYNWAAATAQSGGDTGNAANSFCPYGWRLPTGNTTGEFQSLYNQYPTYDQMRKYPVGMVLGGRYYWGDGTLNYQGETGYYWSSSAYTSATGAYYLSLRGTDSAVYPAVSGLKRNGFPLRCLAQ